MRGGVKSLVLTLFVLFISIGKNLELAILAEGVETKAQEAKLKSLGCDRFQGYLYAKPLAYEDLKAFVKGQNNLYM